MIQKQLPFVYVYRDNHIAFVTAAACKNHYIYIMMMVTCKHANTRAIATVPFTIHITLMRRNAFVLWLNARG